MEFHSAGYQPASGGTEVFPKVQSLEECGDNVAWFYDNNDHPTQVLLCPAACNNVQNNGGTITITFGCETVILE